MSERLALIGAGSIGKRHLRAMSETDKAQLVAIVDPCPAAREMAETLDVPYFADTAEMTRAVKPSGAIIATPTELHLAPALQALRDGCHVLIEKPITATLDEAEQVIALSAQTGLHVLVGHHRRYYPQVEQARSMVQGGELGQLVAVSGQWCVRKPAPYYEPDWRKRWQAGPVLTNLIHEMDYLRYICGPVVSIQAETGNQVQGFEKEDVAAMVLRFASGALGAFILSDQADSPWAWEFATGENVAFPRSGQNAIRFVGTKGALDFPNLQHWVSGGDDPSWTSPKAVQDLPMELGDAYIRQIEHFADVIAGRATPRITARDATETLRATLAVLESAKSGLRIVL